MLVISNSGTTWPMPKLGYFWVPWTSIYYKMHITFFQKGVDNSEIEPRFCFWDHIWHLTRICTKKTPQNLTRFLKSRPTLFLENSQGGPVKLDSMWQLTATPAPGAHSLPYVVQWIIDCHETPFFNADHVPSAPPGRALANLVSVLYQVLSIDPLFYADLTQWPPFFFSHPLFPLLYQILHTNCKIFARFAHLRNTFCFGLMAWNCIFAHYDGPHFFFFFFFFFFLVSTPRGQLQTRPRWAPWCIKCIGPTFCNLWGKVGRRASNWGIKSPLASPSPRGVASPDCPGGGQSWWASRVAR